MPLHSSVRGGWKWAAFGGFWTLLGLSFGSQFYISSARAGMAMSWSQAITYSLADWYVWALVSLPVVALARRFPLAGARWIQSLLIHLAGSAVASIAYIFLRATVEVAKGWLANQTFSFREVIEPLLVKTFHFNVLIYWVIVSVTHAFEYYRKFQEREWRGAELEKRLAEARLHALQMQLNPHFLFNTLHAISSLMHKDVEAADRMIVRLGDLLRYALESTHAQEVPLRQELDFLKRYLEIEQTRFGDRLEIRMNVDADALDALVPNLVLQPLVENAIQHGIEPHARRGEIEVAAHRDRDDLVISVADNGGGLAGNGQVHDGVGLSNTRARLQQLYGARQEMDLSNRCEGGLAVTLKLPWRSATLLHPQNSHDD